MIEIADHEVPSNAAPLTVAETMEGLRDRTLAPAHGDMILELRSRSTGRLEARLWLGKDGVVTVDGLRLFVRCMSAGSTYHARILWIAHPEKVN